MVSTAAMVLIIFLSLFVILTIGGIILLWKFGKDKSKKVPPNSPLVIFFDKSVSQGYAIAALMDKKSEFRGRMTLKVKPLDLAYDKKGKPVKIEPFDVPVRTNLIQQSPVGWTSLYREIWFVAPENISEINSEFRETPLGQSIEKWSVIKQLDDHRFTVHEQAEELKNVESAELGKEENRQNRLYRKMAEDAVNLQKLNHLPGEDKK